jgi:hypothetical protein
VFKAEGMIGGISSDVYAHAYMHIISPSIRSDTTSYDRLQRLGGFQAGQDTCSKIDENDSNDSDCRDPLQTRLWLSRSIHSLHHSLKCVVC